MKAPLVVDIRLGMIAFSLSVVIRRSRHTDCKTCVGAILEPSRVLPGCICCHLYADTEESDAFTLAQEWVTQEDLDLYLGSDAFKTLVAAIEMSEEPPAIRFDTVS